MATAMTTGSIKLHPGWLERLRPQFAEPYMTDLKRFLTTEKEQGKRIFPKGANWFRALDLTPPDEVRVVILGQDPYHGPARRTACASRCRTGSIRRRASGTYIGNWSAILASRRRGTAFSNIGRNRACCS